MHDLLIMDCGGAQDQWVTTKGRNSLLHPAWHDVVLFSYRCILCVLHVPVWSFDSNIGENLLLMCT